MYWTHSVNSSVADLPCHYLCASLSRMKSGLSPRSVCVGFAVGEVTLGEISLLVILFSAVSVMPLTLSKFIIHSPTAGAT